jgi:hypothetical protein
VIGVPFDNNDLLCLGSITELVAALVQNRDAVIIGLAGRFQTTEALAAWIRSLPQRNDEGDPEDGPKVEACRPAQRLRIPAADPNCVERAALYLAVAEIIDPWPIRQLGTLDYDWGRHTFPIEHGAPIVLDPRVTAEELARAIPAEARAQHETAHGAGAPVAIDINEAINFTSELGRQGAAKTRNGPSRAHLARNAIRSLVETGTPPADSHTVDAMGWFFATAEEVARGYGTRALTIVRTTAKAISELVDDILARGQRNLPLALIGSALGVPSWLSGLGSVLGKIGLDVGAVAVKPKLAKAGVNDQMLELVEQELNAEGWTLGPLARPGQSFTSALGAIANTRPY